MFSSSKETLFRFNMKEGRDGFMIWAGTKREVNLKKSMTPLLKTLSPYWSTKVIKMKNKIKKYFKPSKAITEGFRKGIAWRKL